MAAHHLDPSERDHAPAAAPADLPSPGRLAAAIAEGVELLESARPSYWWLVRLTVIERNQVHLERVSAPDSRQACKLASIAAGDKWPGCTFYVTDLVQEGL